MSRGRFEPGARCVVIGEDPGYECNIGVMVTLRSQYTGMTPKGMNTLWLFDDASRPIKVGRYVQNGGVGYYEVTSSDPWVDGLNREWVAGYPPKYLLPIGGEDLGDEENAGDTMKLTDGAERVFSGP